MPISCIVSEVILITIDGLSVTSESRITTHLLQGETVLLITMPVILRACFIFPLLANLQQLIHLNKSMFIW